MVPIRRRRRRRSSVSIETESIDRTYGLNHRVLIYLDADAEVSTFKRIDESILSLGDRGVMAPMSRPSMRQNRQAW
jgi:hypothetical protein